MRKLIFLLAYIISTQVSAITYEFQLEQLVGWTLVASKQIQGSKAPEKPFSNQFEGCNLGTVIYFTDGTSLECVSFGFQFAFMPKAFIFAREVELEDRRILMLKMLVEGELYDVY